MTNIARSGSQTASSGVTRSRIFPVDLCVPLWFKVLILNHKDTEVHRQEAKIQ
jgi:hypothetical protein